MGGIVYLVFSTFAATTLEKHDGEWTGPCQQHCGWSEGETVELAGPWWLCGQNQKIGATRKIEVQHTSWLMVRCGGGGESDSNNLDQLHWPHLSSLGDFVCFML